MKIVFRIIFFIIGILFLAYLSLPNPGFPKTLWDFKPSTEPSDQESPLRRGYYTLTTREQLMEHYKSEFSWGIVLNYPPEDAQTIIRDQTKSSFLQEIVHPMRESLYINGYTPPGDGNPKVIVKLVPSNIVVRLAVGLSSLVLIWIVVSEWILLFKKNKWNYQ